MKKPITISLGITGGIAAYKSASLCSALVQAGFVVKVVMTQNACRFVTPLVFQTLSQNPVTTSLWDVPAWQPEHVALADETDILVIAPATADILAKMAHGIADDALSTLAATFSGKTLVAPAMNPAMWAHPACKDNVKILKKRGVLFCGPVTGHVACGKNEKAGRMAEPEEIFTAIRELLK